MLIQLNGHSTLLSHAQTLEDLLSKNSIHQCTAGIAVALNGRIVFRENWATTNIADGDQIEVVHAVSGG